MIDYLIFCPESKYDDEEKDRIVYSLQIKRLPFFHSKFRTPYLILEITNEIEHFTSGETITVKILCIEKGNIMKSSYYQTKMKIRIPILS